VDTRTFFNLVVPWSADGYVTIHWVKKRDGIFRGMACRTVDEALHVVDRFKAGPPSEIYFCLSRQAKDSGHRSVEHAQELCSLWMDGDVDPNNPKKYPTALEAIKAILAFCRTIGIPPPSIVVLSGMGVHCYWLSNRPLPVEEWRRYAIGFKALARSAGLKVDYAVMADAARILRVPDTINWKYEEPKPVAIVQSATRGKIHDFAAAFSPCLTAAPAAQSSNVVQLLGPVPAAFAHLPVNNMGAGVEDYPPMPVEPILAGCPWLREAYETGGKDFCEPEWNLTTLAATFMEDGHALAHKFADRHPDYSFGETEEKWDTKDRARRAKGVKWPSCRAIQDAGSRHCDSCPHFQHGKSPLHLGLPTADATKDAETQELGGTRPEDLKLPPGFCLKNGRIHALIPGKPNTKGVVGPSRLVQLCRNIITSPTLHCQDGVFSLGLIATTDKGNSQELLLSSINCYSPGLFTKLAEKAVFYENSREAKLGIERLMYSWLERLMQEQEAVRDSGTLGWRYEDGERVGFVYGGILYGIDGSESAVRYSSDDEFRKWYQPVGKKEPWLAACKLLTDRKRPELDCIVAVAFAAPLMVFTGTVYGCMLNVFGGTGSGKSVAQQVAAAVFGSPKQTRESLNSTPKSVQGRLGRTRNLPAYWDDVQDERHQEALFQTMFVASEGTEGGRLNPDTSYKERKEWQTLMVACSNASLVEFLLKKQKSTTAGIRRVFEFEFTANPSEPGMIDAIDAHKIFATLEHNYGIVGQEYARLLTAEHNQIDDLLSRVTRTFKEGVRGSTDENFWWSLCGVLLVGASLANRLGAELDVSTMAGFLADAYLLNRRIRTGEGTEAGTRVNTDLSLSTFLNHYAGAGHAVCTDISFHHKNQTVNVYYGPVQGRPIYIHIIYNERRILISKRKLREDLQERGIQSRQVMEGMVKYYGARDIKATLGAGVGIGLAQEQCIEILVPPGQKLLEPLFTFRGEPKPNVGLRLV
jgi:hypothetical protein